MWQFKLYYRVFLVWIALVCSVIAEIATPTPISSPALTELSSIVHATPMRPEALFKPYRLYYTLHAHGIEFGEMSRELIVLSPQHYSLISITQVTGLAAIIRDDVVRETSLWRYHDGKIEPMFYEYHHQSSQNQRHLSISFNWGAYIAHHVFRNKNWNLRLPKTGQILDKQLYQIALTADLVQNKSGERRYRVADGGGLKNYILNDLGNETITTPWGELNTRKYSRRSAHKKNRWNYLWLAPTLSWLPVQMEFSDSISDRLLIKLQKADGIQLKQ